MHTGQVHYHWATTGTPLKTWLSKLSTRVGINFFQTPVNVDILTCFPEFQMCLMASKMVNHFWKVFNIVCSDSSEEWWIYGSYSHMQCISFLKFLLEYSWFTMFCEFLLYRKVTQSFTHTHILFLVLSSIMFYHKWLIIVPFAIQQGLIAYPF